MEEARAHLFIDGRVQGVFYRAFTGEVAHTFGLKGWVKHLRDGRVEALFEGDKNLIQKAIQSCYAGQAGAKVSNVDVKWEPYTGEEKGFSVRYW